MGRKLTYDHSHAVVLSILHETAVQHAPPEPDKDVEQSPRCTLTAFSPYPLRHVLLCSSVRR
eukprot:757529-Hanusia_phi.AAC.3